MSAPLRRIGIERIELVLEDLPAERARLLAGQLEPALAAHLAGVRGAARGVAEAIAAQLTDAIGGRTWR